MKLIPGVDAELTVSVVRALARDRQAVTAGPDPVGHDRPGPTLIHRNPAVHKPPPDIHSDAALERVGSGPRLRHHRSRHEHRQAGATGGRGRAERARLDPDRPRGDPQGRRLPAPARLLPPAALRHLRGDARPARPARADRPGDARRRAGAARPARADRRAGLPGQPDEHGADRGPRRALRADRRAQGGAPQPDRGGRQDRGGRLRGGERRRGGDRPRRGDPVRDQPAPHGRRLRVAGDPARPGVRPARVPPRAPRPAARHPERPLAARRAARRLPAVGPDHPGRAARASESRAWRSTSRSTPRCTRARRSASSRSR